MYNLKSKSLTFHETSNFKPHLQAILPNTEYKPMPINASVFIKSDTGPQHILKRLSHFITKCFGRYRILVES